MPRPYAALATGPMGRSRYCEFVVCRGEACLAPTLRWRPGLRDEVGTYEFVVCRGDACVAPTLRWRPGLWDEAGTTFEVRRGEACLALFGGAVNSAIPPHPHPTSFAKQMMSTSPLQGEVWSVHHRRGERPSH